MTLGHLMLDIEGLHTTAEDRELLARPQVGGLILFARNYESPLQLQCLIAEIRAIRPELLIAVDQEGGRVQRLKTGFTRLPPMRALARCYEHNAGRAQQVARQAGWLMASEVLAAGIDLSFAPVLDIDTGLSEVIGDRAFGSSAEIVIALAGAFIDGMHRAGMAATGKHFPGHGGVQADSHHELPVDSRGLAELEMQDLLPFRALATRLEGIMPAHVVYQAVDAQPAGFSHYWLQTVLRQQLSFEGVIFSDDLSMAGARMAGGYRARAAAALEAGCDLVLVCNDRAGAIEVLDYLAGEGLAESLRLAGLRARSYPDPEALRASPQWRDAVAALAGLRG